MAKRKRIDWQAIEKDYRLGQLSLRALATKHGTTPGAISKRANKEGWVKDATQEVRERTRAALITNAKPADDDGAKETEGNSVSNKGNAPTHEDIEVAVQTNLSVITRHRKDIAYGHGLVGMLLGQLQEAARDREEIEDAIIEETAGDQNSQRRNKMLKAVGIPTHAAVIRDLSTAMKNLIPLERQAYNLDETNAEETYEERLKRLMGQP